MVTLHRGGGVCGRGIIHPAVCHAGSAGMDDQRTPIHRPMEARAIVIQDRGAERLSPRGGIINAMFDRAPPVAGTVWTARPSRSRGMQVVDLGCGDRPYEADRDETRGEVYVACDLEENVDVRIVPGGPIPLDDASADGVVSFQVLEHVWDIDWYLRECPDT